MLQSDPSKWRFNQSELQWLYALGIAYGVSDTSGDDTSNDSDTEETEA
jgi:hypothetical protein